jgi:zinc protease
MSETHTRTYPYTTVPNDPLHFRHYTLDNGLQVFLSVNPDEPRVFTNICFRAGSKYDPADTTGLAHYMEHMLFKGTSQIGALNWEEESKLLEQIADLFEEYRQTTDTTERQRIYREIDRLSYEAAQLVAPNEYDRLMTAMGAKSTNAYTWLEQTVYVNDIPNNEIKRWVKLERERFRHLALRLFHTELETVYEEFNMSQDKDFRKANQALRRMLFPTHPYGTQTTLGRPEHLKNPSMRNIERFFETYYVPNNAALCLAGDFDPDEVIALIDESFGDWKPNDFPPFTYEEQPPLTSTQRESVYGQESAYLMIGWRTTGGHDTNYMMGLLVKQMLHNEQAGLIDLHLNQQQRVLEAEAFNWVYEDYSVFGLFGKAREGQALAEVEGLLLEQVEKLRQGDFPDWLLPAAIKDMKQADLKAAEKNQSRVSMISTSYILGISYEQLVKRYEWLEKVTREDVIHYAREILSPNSFAVVYKEQGTDPKVVKVEKPDITPVPIQREAISDYAKDFLSESPQRISPVFADFKGRIQQEEWQPGLRFDYVHNPHNPLFQLQYIFEMGKNNSQELALAMQYLPYLGTSKYSAAEIQQYFFKLGLHFDAFNGNDRLYVSLSGLEESLEEGLELVEQILADVQADARAWEAVVTDTLTKRDNQKLQKDTILYSGLRSFAKYGPESPFTYRMPANQLRQLSPEAPLKWIHDLHTYEHRVYYFGQLPQTEVAKLVRRHHRVAEKLKTPPPPQAFVELPTMRNQVFFTHFPMVQNEVLLLSRGTPHFNLEEHLWQDLYNEYFGYGLSSIVFQEIREAKALAYSTYAYYGSPIRQNQAHYLSAYVGTQPDKVSDAVPTLFDLLEHMPVVEKAVEQAQQSILQRIESDRIEPRRLYREAQSVWDVGLDRDILRDAYEHLQQHDYRDLVKFQETHVKNRNYNLLVLGDRANTPLPFLERYGPVRELSLEELFGY